MVAKPNPSTPETKSALTSYLEPELDLDDILLPKPRKVDLEKELLLKPWEERWVQFDEELDHTLIDEIDFQARKRIDLEKKYKFRKYELVREFVKQNPGLVVKPHQRFRRKKALA